MATGGTAFKAGSGVLGLGFRSYAEKVISAFLAGTRATLGWDSVKKRVDAVPKSLRILLRRLAEAGICKEFYLAGGTGPALLLGHRRSVDLDFFSERNRLDFADRRLLLSRLKSLRGWGLTEAKDGTVHGRVGRVWVSFFSFPEPLLKSPIRRGSLRIAALHDIGLMKIGAIIGCGARKDFVDLYHICRELPLSRLLALSPRKFRDSRDFTLQGLKALAFFEDADREPAVPTVKPLAWEKVKEFFRGKVQTLARDYLK